MLPAQEALKNLLSHHLEQAEKGQLHLEELNTIPSPKTIESFIFEITLQLEFDRHLVQLGLSLTKRAIDSGLRINKSCAYKLITISLILAEKFLFIEHHSLETYSFISGIPIDQLIHLEAYILQLLDFKLLPEQEELETLGGPQLRSRDLITAGAPSL